MTLVGYVTLTSDGIIRMTSGTCDRFQTWDDQFLDWDPADYNDTDFIVLYADDVWLPDTVIYNRCVLG